MREEIFGTVRTMLAEILQIDESEIKSDSYFMEDLDISSLEVMAVIGDLEEKYGIVFKNEELQSLASIDDIVNCIMQKKGFAE